MPRRRRREQGNGGVNLLARRLIDLWLALLARYYALRYGPVARRLDAPAVPRRRKFIIIEIDGLGHDTLVDAVTKGYAPYIGGLLRSGQAEASRWFCGVPSTTPVSQAGIMFGNSFDIPGFRWYDKGRGISVVCKSPGAMNALQQQVAEDRVGILEGGASYANMFDGGASISLFTLSAFGRTSLFRKVGGLGLFLVLLFSPVRVTRIIVLSLWTYLTGIWQQLASLFWPTKFWRMSLLAPFFHLLTDVVVREIETFAVLVDLYRGLPSIYVTYTSYDDWAHRFGPRDKTTYRAIRAIDREIQHIDRMRRYGAKEQYDLYILSDHGMSPSVSFETVFGRSLGQAIGKELGESVLADEATGGSRPSASAGSLLADEVAVAEVRLLGLPSRLARRLRHRLHRREVHEPARPEPSSQIVVRNSGPLSHVYFRGMRHALKADEIEQMYPGLIQRLARHPGVGLVAARTPDGPLCFTSDGRYPYRPGVGSTLFQGLPDSAGIERGLARLLEFPHSGDLVVLGHWSLWGSDELVVSFERQRGTHGGVGGEQCYPFVVAVAEREHDFSQLQSPEELYPFFLTYTQPEPADRVAGAETVEETGAAPSA